MVIFFMENIDLSGRSPAQEPQTPTTPAPSGDADPDILIRRDVNDGRERRGMRLVLSVCVLFFAVIFLWNGLFFALNVGCGLLQAKSSIVTALTKNTEVVDCQASQKCAVQPNKQPNIAPKETLATNKSESAIPNLSTDWLSASSLIAIVAFILGVGLTLLLTLLKAAFHHPTDKNLNGKTPTTTIELATPLSELIMGVINYIKGKISK